MSTINGTSGNDTLKGTSVSDFIYGLEGNDILWGYDGNDWLNGGLGADILFGAGGNDTYFVDNVLDKVVDASGNGGDDWVFASVGHTLSAYVEHLILTGSANLKGVGNALDNSLNGNAGNNILDGMSGADLMKGGLGNDQYRVDNQADKIVESANAGQDSITSVISYVLPANVENLYLSGAANLYGTGNDLNNKIGGNDGANSLNGGMGVDTLSGGKGDDSYIVDNSNDAAIEKIDEGYDSVSSWVDYALGAHIEKLSLLGSFAIEGTGNELDNTLIGNTADNILNGDKGDDLLMGGTGNDWLSGGSGTNTLQGESGDDTYIASDSDDTFIEEADGGTDTVAAAVSWTLGANFENLKLDRTADINGVGNDADNVMTGNLGKNVLSGLAGNDTLQGSNGNDSLYGGLGDDIYIVSTQWFSPLSPTHDLVFENPNEGNDTVKSWSDFSLGDNLENLILQGDSNLNGAGNTANNNIQGNNGDNILNGGGGTDWVSYADAEAGVAVSLALSGAQDTGGAGMDTLINFANLMGGNFDDTLSGNAMNNSLAGGIGADTLLGGAGSDRFFFLTAPEPGETDTVLDFASGNDSLQLQQSVFDNIGNAGQFGANDERFFVGANAHDASDRIIYDAGNGALYYDADGNGAGVAIQFASLTGQPNLVATDIWVV